MHDIKWVRENPEQFEAAMIRRGFGAGMAQKALELDKQKRGNIGDLQSLQEESNRLAKEIGQLMAQGKKDEAQNVIARSKEVKAQLAAVKDEQKEGDETTKDAVTQLLETLPNIMLDEVPDGADEDANHIINHWGSPKKAADFGFEPKDHVALAEGLASPFLSAMDFEQTARISGSRFSTLTGSLARLERALGDFMLDTHIKEFGYLEVSPPVLVRDDAMYGTSQLPKFTEDSYNTGEHWLVPTAEVPLTNLVRETMLDASQLPLRFVARTPCFRSEAGSAGKDTRGLIRQHQFNKVELVSIVSPEETENEHQRLLKAAETILQKLNLPYRTSLLCSGDTGFGSQKTYDFEVWLPGQDAYREISSCSQFGAFQARRMNARFRPTPDAAPEFVHTLNGSGLAIGRTLIAVLENYQQKDGSILVPDVLQSYLDGNSVIK